MLDKLTRIAHRYKISDLYVFGSRADEITTRVMGIQATALHPDSDVDIAVAMMPGKTLSAREKVKLAIELEDLFRVPRVDLVLLSEVSPFLGLEVIKGKLLYCVDPDEQAEQELLILRRAGDLAYYERKRRQELLGKAG